MMLITTRVRCYSAVVAVLLVTCVILKMLYNNESGSGVSSVYGSEGSERGCGSCVSSGGGALI